MLPALKTDKWLYAPMTSDQMVGEFLDRVLATEDSWAVEVRAYALYMVEWCTLAVITFTISAFDAGDRADAAVSTAPLYGAQFPRERP